jgi:hypothetical protein
MGKLPGATADKVVRKIFAVCFVPNGLSGLVLVDSGSELKSEMITMLENLGVSYEVVSPENHNAILCKCFHRCMKKVGQIKLADTQSFGQWAMMAYFATYARNAPLIDGTDNIRFYAAKARMCSSSTGSHRRRTTSHTHMGRSSGNRPYIGRVRTLAQADRARRDSKRGKKTVEQI